MSNKALLDIASTLQDPCYILEEDKLIKNLEILNLVQKESGAKILLALKGFAFWASFNLVSQYLKGITASGVYEAQLGYEEFRKYNKYAEISVFSPAFRESDIKSIIPYSNHIIFNSFNQYKSLKHLLKDTNIDIGLRVNPMYSEIETPIYNPCIEGSRLGIIPSEFEIGKLKYGIDDVCGIHFHTHCEQDSKALFRTLPHFERYFGKYLSNLKWVNFGGGHHITRKDYDIDLLISIIKNFKDKYNGIDVYLEPGEAIGWQCGVLIGEVIDLVKNKFNIAITNLSAATHMPDCIEMPYTPNIYGAKITTIDASKFKYRLGSPSCLAGDIIGDYEFDRELKIGDKIIIEDMIHYTIVKNNTFNGIPLPSLGILRSNGEFEIIKKFGYEDYKYRNS